MNDDNHRLRTHERTLRFAGRPMILLLLLALFDVPAAVAEGSVWRVAGEHGTLYLAGSVHVLRPADYPLPESFDRAYRQSAFVMLETDLGAVEPAAVQQLLQRHGKLPAGETLEEHLSTESYRRLAEYCREQDIPLAAIEHYRPWVVVITLSAAAMRRQGFTSEAGVDRHFHRRAREDGKPVVGLEAPEAHLNLMLSFGRELGDSLVASFLDEMRELPTIMDELIGAWRRGDGSALDRLVGQDLRERYPDLYRVLIADRNRRWLDVLERRLEAGQTGMAVVGAAHLAGEDGLLGGLRQRGYRVRRADH